jgi:hypothetical protein
VGFVIMILSSKYLKSEGFSTWRFKFILKPTELLLAALDAGCKYR